MWRISEQHYERNAADNFPINNEKLVNNELKGVEVGLKGLIEDILWLYKAPDYALKSIS